MSSRQIRKLQQQKELERAKLQQQAEEEGSSEEEDTFHPPPKPSGFSAFAALQDGNDEDDDEDDEEPETAAKPTPKPLESESEDEQPVAPAKKAKKSKKKKKKAAKTKTPEEQDVDLDDIDAVLAELKLKEENEPKQDEGPQLDPGYEEICRLLIINSQNLKVANEMRNLFGRTAIAPETPQPRQRDEDFHMDLETALRGRHRPGKGMPELSLKRNIFITGKDEWPRGTTGGLTMEMVDDQSPDGTVEYRFVHSQAYENVQNQFRHFVEMGDPQNLVGLLMREPYNISLLLQVSKIAKNQSDHSLSNDLIERALFTFGRAATSSFGNKLKEGKARLDFARPENREFWLAGYHYIKSLIMKGTYRTAFEWAKLLYSLDPEADPYALHLMLPQLAYRAHEFEWLQKYAVCFSMLDSRYNNRQPFIAATVALACMSDKNGREARVYLESAMRQVPYFFTSLLKELNLDPPTPFWGKTPSSKAEELLCEIFIAQTKDLWNTPEATSLLMEMAYKQTAFSPLHLADSEISLGDARFVYLDNNPNLMRIIPSKMLHRQPSSDSDPLPPDEDDNTFSWPAQRLPWERARNEGGGGGGGGGMFGDHFDPLAALRRLIPGFTGDGGEQDEEALRAAGLQDEMRRRLLEIEQRRGVHGGVGVGNPEGGEAVNGDVDANGEGEEALDEEQEQVMEEISNLRRLYGYLFGPREPVSAAEVPEQQNLIPHQPTVEDASDSEDEGGSEGERHMPGGWR